MAQGGIIAGAFGMRQEGMHACDDNVVRECVHCVMCAGGMQGEYVGEGKRGWVVVISCTFWPCMEEAYLFNLPVSGSIVPVYDGVFLVLDDVHNLLCHGSHQLILDECYVETLVVLEGIEPLPLNVALVQQQGQFSVLLLLPLVAFEVDVEQHKGHGMLFQLHSGLGHVAEHDGLHVHHFFPAQVFVISDMF